MGWIELTPEELIGPLNEVEAKHAPKKLYAAGNSSMLRDATRVSIVGSRKASQDGIRRARRLSALLSERGVVIVSGLAEGIDTAAHIAAARVALVLAEIQAGKQLRKCQTAAAEIGQLAGGRWLATWCARSITFRSKPLVKTLESRTTIQEQPEHVGVFCHAGEEGFQPCPLFLAGVAKERAVCHDEAGDAPRGHGGRPGGGRSAESN